MGHADAGRARAPGGRGDRPGRVPHRRRHRLLQFEVQVRHHHDNPWEGLDLLRAAMPTATLRAGTRSNGIVGMGLTPYSHARPLGHDAREARHRQLLDLRLPLRHRRDGADGRHGPQEPGPRRRRRSCSAPPRSTPTPTSPTRSRKLAAGDGVTSVLIGDEAGRARRRARRGLPARDGRRGRRHAAGDALPQHDRARSGQPPHRGRGRDPDRAHRRGVAGERAVDALGREHRRQPAQARPQPRHRHRAARADQHALRPRARGPRATRSARRASTRSPSSTSSCPAG